MNIFVLDESPVLAAQAQHDRHVVKMILESAQMLSASARHLLPKTHESLAYKPTHINHPCNVWVRESDHNAAWLIVHGTALMAEYHRRFRKVHATYGLMNGFRNGLCELLGVARFYERDADRNIIVNPFIESFYANHTRFCYAGPMQYYVGQSSQHVIDSYRQYYIGEKVASNRWSNAVYCPAWLESHMTHHDRWAPKPNRLARPVFAVPDDMRIPTFLKQSINR